jgi:hypothetical protein
MMAVKKICVLLALAGCSPEPTPGPPARTSGTPSVFVVPPTAEAPAPAPPVEVPPVPKATPMARVPVVEPPAPVDIGRPGKPASLIQSPSFYFRGVSGDGGEVYLNGELAGSMPMRWWVSERTAFDPHVAVRDWPPAEGVPAAAGRFQLDGGGWTTMEVHVARASDALRERHPHLAPGESLLLVRATWPGRVMQGALRVRVPGSRWSSYVPTTLTEESSDAATQGRTLWFERD